MSNRFWNCYLPAILFFLALPGTPSLAATISVEADGDEYAIHYNGPVEQGDYEKFRRTASDTPSATVILSSPGGVLAEGLRIGEFIRERAYSTVVKGGAYCASACAFMWLGGASKTIESDGLVGFHAVYINVDGSPISSDGNALAGAYMARLGYNDLAIVYATETPPSGIRWLTPKDASFLEMDVSWLSEGPIKDIPPNMPPEKIEEALQRQTSMKLLKQRMPRAYKGLMAYIYFTQIAGDSWRSGLLIGLRSFMQPGAEFDQAHLRERVVAAAIQLYPSQIIDFMYLRALVWAEKTSPKRCANFSAADFKDYSDSILHPMEDKKPIAFHREFVSIVDSILKVALSSTPPRIDRLTSKEESELQAFENAIGERWHSRLSNPQKRTAKGAYENWPDNMKCRLLVYGYEELKSSPKMSALWLRHQMRPSQ